MDSGMKAPWVHDHTFGQDQRAPGESRALIVIAITATMMTIEIWAGIRYGSMALLADGLHMASHAAALGITAFAYRYARQHATDRRFSFGTGKVNALGGFAGAIVLAVFAIYMAVESLGRFISPVPIIFNQAIGVAVLGLVVNGASVFILGSDGHAHHHHHHDHDHDHDHSHGHQDQNLRSAYLHVMADALTSLLAIFALICAKYLGWVWMDPVMGIVGAVLVGRWSIGLLGTTSLILLDAQAGDSLPGNIRGLYEDGGECEVSDLHVWTIAPGKYAAALTLVAERPLSTTDYRARLDAFPQIVHATIEVNTKLS